MKVVTTVKKGWAAQSKSIQPHMPFSVAFGGCVPVQSMRFKRPLLALGRTVSSRPVARKVGQDACAATVMRARFGSAPSLRLASSSTMRLMRILSRACQAWTGCFSLP